MTTPDRSEPVCVTPGRIHLLEIFNFWIGSSLAWGSPSSLVKLALLVVEQIGFPKEPFDDCLYGEQVFCGGHTEVRVKVTRTFLCSLCSEICGSLDQ